MGVEIEEDIKRKMIELNLVAARKFLSSQTNYIHLHYDTDERGDAIPLLENFCYALALLRSRLADNMTDGKELIEKLLAFEVEGNFPIYLHDFPQCKDRVYSLDILPVWHWAVAAYRAALGEQLALRLEKLICRILSHAYKMHAQRPLSKSADFRLKTYFEPNNVPAFSPSSPEEWADMLITLQMTGGQMPLDALQRWNPQLCTFIGRQAHDRAEPKVTLLDLFMGHYYGSYSQRALKDQRAHLLASLVQS
ncbi:MAG: hypothetical protein HYX67_16190, partial [Candidatus Melainabacteria bacterium]|nr:hypothetical protein [Candidatus Melainabacteria bacterium]